MHWQQKHPRATMQMLGYLPDFLSESNPLSAKKQLDFHYGWRAFPGFTMLANGDLKYPNDPPIPCLFEAKLRNETIRLYEHSWVVILQPDGSFEVARMN